MDKDIIQHIFEVEDNMEKTEVKAEAELEEEMKFSITQSLVWPYFIKLSAK